MRSPAKRVGIALAAGVLSVTVASVTEAAGPAPHATKRSATVNKMGVRIVSFAKGVTRAQMYARVKASGGQVVADLSKVHRLAVVGKAGFDTKMKRQLGTGSIKLDRVIKLDLPDTAKGKKAKYKKPTSAHHVNVDPWHDLDAFGFTGWPTEDAPGVLQWDDDANGARKAWSTTKGSSSVLVAVLDTGVQFDHAEIKPRLDTAKSGSTVDCDLIAEFTGAPPEEVALDCGPEDNGGHGTWVAGRIAGALNGFASNGIAPRVKLMSYKVLSTLAGGGLTSWIVAAMIKSCDAGADIINMSLGGYNRLGTDDDDTQMWIDAVNYCRAKGTAIIASAGNEHVRINSRTAKIGGKVVHDLGIVDSGKEGIGSVIPGSALADTDYRGLLEVPAGIPGVIMVSSTNNANGAPSGYTLPSNYQHPKVGLRDQLAYYSNYGSRIDVAAPGGARKIGIPRYDGGPNDVLYGGWGELGPSAAIGELCATSGAPSTFACFTDSGYTFGWLQGTSMAAPNATGVAALALSAKKWLQGHPAALQRVLESSARDPKDDNQTGPNDPKNTSADYFGNACPTGWCHLKYGRGLINNRSAYGAGIVNAAAAVR